MLAIFGRRETPIASTARRCNVGVAWLWPAPMIVPVFELEQALRTDENPFERVRRTSYSDEFSNDSSQS